VMDGGVVGVSTRWECKARASRLAASARQMQRRGAEWVNMNVDANPDEDVVGESVGGGNLLFNVVFAVLRCIASDK
jgi:hypothetical protein